MQSEDPWDAKEAGTLPQFGLLKALFLSWGHPGFYRDVADRWRGGGLLYLTLLSALTWLPVAIKAIYALVMAMGFATDIGDMPSFEIQNGQFSAAVEQPFVLEEDGELQVLIDTTGTANQDDIDRAKVYVNADEIVMERQFDTRTVSFNDFDDMQVDGATMSGYYQNILIATAVLVYPLGVLSTVVWRGAWSALYGAFLALAMGRPFLAGMRVSVVSSTPVVVLGTLWFVVGWTPPLWFVVGWFMLLIWMAVAAVMVRKGDVEA